MHQICSMLALSCLMVLFCLSDGHAGGGVSRSAGFGIVTAAMPVRMPGPGCEATPTRNIAPQESMGKTARPLSAEYRLTETGSAEDRQYQYGGGEQGRNGGKAEAGNPLVIQRLTYEAGKGGSVRVLIQANGFFQPQVFSMDGDKPRLVIDIKNTAAVEGIPPKIVVNSPLVQQIRTSFHREKNLFRVVLDHYPSRKYIVNQKFFKPENTYVVEIDEER